MKTLLVWFSVLALMIWVPLPLRAQDTASITGTVTDSSGAAVANAQVTITDSELGVKHSATTNGSGDYLFAALPIGSYDMTVTVPGFKTYEAKGVVLRVGQKARNDVQLAVGVPTTEVTVQGTEVAQVETESSDLAGIVTGKEITQLELNGRVFAQLVTLVPGVSNQSGQDEGAVGVNGNVAFSVNGGRTEYNNWELDGGDNLDNGSNTSMNVYPSIEAIAEFKVMTSNYGAQYGRNGSGTVEVETKSGTKQFHGVAYEFLRNDMFNAQNYFNDLSHGGTGITPEYKKHDFGYTLGGPVFIPGVYNQNRDKTFFFWSQEWRRDRVPGATSVTTVPTTTERAGDFSDVCPPPGTPYSTAESGLYPNCPVTNPASTNPLMPGGGPNWFPNYQVPIDTADGADALEALIPAPTGGPGSSTWQASPILPTTWREELVRVDHNFSDRVRGTFRYIHDSWATVYPVPLWTSGTSFPTIETDFNGPAVGMIARLTATISPTLLNEFVASYTTDHINLTLVGPWKRPASMSWGLFPNGGSGKVSGISLNGGEFGGIAEDPGYIPNGPLNSNPTYTYRDNVTKVVGNHNLQFGGYFTAAQKNEIPQPGISTNGLLTFDTTNSQVSTLNAFADLLMGNVSQFQQQKAAIKTYNRYKILEPYFQDDWHATRRLTLNLGLRLSLFGTQRERYHNAWNWDPAHYVAGASALNPDGTLVSGGNQFNGWVDCGVGGIPVGCTKGHLFNPAPRIGFAFDPKGDGKWAVRAGYGVFFEHMNATEAGTGALEPQNPLTLTTSVHNVGGYAAIAPQPGILTPLSVISLPDQIHWPYVQQWHMDVQHDLLKNTVATLAYVGSKGTHLTRELDFNQVLPTPLSQNPYKPGEPIGPNDCSTFTTPSNVPITGQAAVNLQIACGGNPDLFRPFQGISGINRKDQSASSVYHAMQFAVRHTVGGLALNLAYTYSHSIDNASSGIDTYFPNAYNFGRASSNFDQRHLFSLSYVYDLPFFKGAGLSHKVLGGWQWSGITIVQSGSPFSVANGGGGSVPGDNAGVGNTVTSIASYPDLAGNPKSGIAQVPGTTFGPALFNPGAFVAPRGLTFGDISRNFLNNPRRTNFDMALFKRFALTERTGLEFRAEAFNVFNHTEFAWLGGGQGSAASNSPFSSPTSTNTCYGGANNSAGDVTCVQAPTAANPNYAGSGFLRAAAAHNPRILQLALKFLF